jgi:hypothetical protein
VQQAPKAKSTSNSVFLTKKISIAAEVEKHMVVLTTVGKTNIPIEILCASLAFEDGLIENGRATGSLSLSACETYINKVLASACKPAEPVVGVVKGLPILHEKHIYLLLQPLEAGNPIGIISFGTECSTGEKLEIVGSIVVRDCNELNDLAVDQKVHLIEEAPASLFPGTGIKFGTHPATLDGSANLTLLGEHANLPWKESV